MVSNDLSNPFQSTTIYEPSLMDTRRVVVHGVRNDARLRLIESLKAILPESVAIESRVAFEPDTSVSYPDECAGVIRTQFLSMGSEIGLNVEKTGEEPRGEAAATLAFEPYMILVNERKIGRSSGDSWTLSELSRRGFRAHFSLSDHQKTGECGWALPILNEYLHLAASGGHAKGFLDPECLDGLTRLREQLLSKISISNPLKGVSAAYEDLMSPIDSETVAIYGNPLQLSRLATERGWPEFSTQVAQVPLANFLQSAITPIARTLSLEFGVARLDPVTEQIGLALRQVLRNACNTYISGLVGASEINSLKIAHVGYDINQYRNLKELSYWTDGGFAAEVLRNLSRSVSSQEESRTVVRSTAAEAFRVLSRRDWARANLV